jgi:hypothetical protein
MSEAELINAALAFALMLACHPERSEGSHTDCAIHTNVPGVVKHPVGGPSPSPRPGMTAV